MKLWAVEEDYQAAIRTICTCTAEADGHMAAAALNNYAAMLHWNATYTCRECTPDEVREA